MSKINIQALLVLLLAVACFFGGVRFEREWRRRADEAAALAAKEATSLGIEPNVVIDIPIIVVPDDAGQEQR
jgi:hypothetical protein